MQGSVIHFSKESRKELAAKAKASEAALTPEQKEARKKAHEAEQERAEAALQVQAKEQRAAEKIYAHVRGHHTRKHKGKRGGTRRRRGTRKTRRRRE